MEPIQTHHIAIQHDGKIEDGYMSNAFRDVTTDRFRDLRKPRVVTFFVNGDDFFKGLELRITPHRYTSFDELLNDLTRRLYSVTSALPMGVRRIYNLRGHMVKHIDHLLDRGLYVCAGLEVFKPSGEAPYAMFLENLHDHGAHHAQIHHTPQPRQMKYVRQTVPKLPPVQHEMIPSSRYQHTENTSRSKTRPITPKSKVITIVRNSAPPRTTLRVKVNRRSIHSLGQLLNDISDALTPRNKINRILKLYTTSGRVVHHVDELFGSEDTFIGVNQERLTRYDLDEILDDLYNDNTETCDSYEGADYIDDDLEKGREWSRRKMTRRATNHYRRQYHHHHRASSRQMQRNMSRSSKRFLKEEDSGLEEEDTVGYSERQQEMSSDYAQVMGTRIGRTRHDLSILSETERATHRELERLRASLIERERARLFRIKTLDSRNKRFTGMIGPAKAPITFEDPFRKMDNEREQARIDRLRIQYAEERLARERAYTCRHAEDEQLEVEALRRLSAKGTVREPIVIEEYVKHPHSHRRLEPSMEVKSIATSRSRQVPVPPPVISPRRRERDKGLITWIIDIKELLERYRLEKKLGDGNYAVVREAIQVGTLQEYAVKIVEKAKLDERDRGMLIDEVRLMRACNHPNIVRLYEEYETDTDIYMVMETVKGGDLFDEIKQNIKFTEKQTAVVVADLANALFYLHSRSIVHRDLKPENILVVRTPKGLINVKLCDFGLATELRNPLTMVCGTPTYVAPEILIEKGYGLPVDLWALGVITFVLLCGYPPFRSPERRNTELFEFIKAGDYEYLAPYWNDVSKVPRELIDKLLVVDPQKRYTAVDVLCHPWIMQEGGFLPLNKSPTKEQIANHRSDLQRRALEGLTEFQSLATQLPPYHIPPKPTVKFRDLSDNNQY